MSVTFKCPNCGGTLIFDPDTQQFKCEYCMSFFTEEYLQNEAKKELKKEEERKESEMNVFHCTSCGAEIVTDETRGAMECFYCHSPLVFSKKFTDDLAPDYIIPFKISKEKMQEGFFKWAGKKRYIQKGFLSKNKIDKVNGVYFPYWISNHEVQATYKGEGTTVSKTRSGNTEITTTRYYNVVRKGRILFKNLPRPALKGADKQLAEAILPFNYPDCKDFTLIYFSGFQAEKKDIEIADIQTSVEDEVKSYLTPVLTKDTKYDSLRGNSSLDIPINSSYAYYMLPAWVMTYRDGSTMYYYEMNAQTGEVCGKLPINGGKLTVHSMLFGLLGVVIGLGFGYVIDSNITIVDGIVSLVLVIILFIMYRSRVKHDYGMLGSQYDYNYLGNSTLKLSYKADDFIKETVSKRDLSSKSN